MVVVVCTSPRCLLGLESGYRSRFKNGWCIQRRISIVLVDNSLREDHYCFLKQWKLIPLKGNSEAVYYPEAGEATSTGSEHATRTAAGKASLAKKMHQTWKTQCLHFHQGLPIVPNLQDPILFQSRLLSTLKDWKFRFLCNSVSHRMRFCFWFSRISALRL